MMTLERVRRGPSGATQPFTPSLTRQPLINRRRFASRLPQERPGLPGAPKGHRTPKSPPDGVGTAFVAAGTLRSDL
jgi:hypothetical protein